VRRLLDDPAFIRLAKRPPVAFARRRHDRAWEIVSHMTGYDLAYDQGYD